MVPARRLTVRGQPRGGDAAARHGHHHRCDGGDGGDDGDDGNGFGRRGDHDGGCRHHDGRPGGRIRRGTWTVDTSVGEFSFEDSTGTFVGFRVEEELSSIGSTTAVGRTPTVTGEIMFDGTTLSAATIEADMTAISTNESRRDDNVQSAMETDQFPTATFVLTQPIDLSDAVNTGVATRIEATGDLTIHGVTTPVTLPLDAQLVDGTIVVVGSLDIALSTYGVEAPTAPIVVSVSDQAVVEFQLFFAQA